METNNTKLGATKIFNIGGYVVGVARYEACPTLWECVVKRGNKKFPQFRVMNQAVAENAAAHAVLAITRK